MDFDLLKNAAIDVLKNIPNRPFLCLPMSAIFYAVLRDNHNIEAELITGDLLYKEQYIFKQDFSINANLGDKLKLWSGHAWVKVGNYNWDLSFFRTLYADAFDKDYKKELIDQFGKGRGLLCTQPEDLMPYKMRYHPIDTLSDQTATGIINGLEFLL